MFSMRGTRPGLSYGRMFPAAMLCAGLLAAAPAPAAAQDDPNRGALTISGGYDFLNQYMFRGLRQNSTGIAMWPWADLGIAAYEGDGGLKTVSVNLGTWNSLHTGDTGSDGPSDKLWYESDFYVALGFGFSAASFTTTYTAYTSPNNSFSTVKEIMFRLGIDDSGYLGSAAVNPYVAIAREFGDAQADGGAEAGTYLELGIGPGYSGAKASITVPVKIGLSVGDYYELDGTDNKFGYFSIGGLVTVPLGGTTKFGSWNVHFGAEYQRLGDTTSAFNLGDNGQPKKNQGIVSGGIGFSY